MTEKQESFFFGGNGVGSHSFNAEQLGDLPPASRNTDPVSSHAAEQEITKSGVKQTHMDETLRLVKIWPGKTCQELVELTGGKYDRHQVGRRLSDLKNKGKIKQGPVRKCKVARRLCVTWYTEY